MSSASQSVGKNEHSRYVNQLHGRSGHLWQGRFHSCILDESHYGHALRYVEQNPVRARMVRRAWRYPWSSAGVHCGMVADDALLDLSLWREYHGDEARWKEVQLESTNRAFQEALRLKTRTGRPLGSDNFLSHLETVLGRRNRPLPVGRPRGSKTKKRGK